MKSHFDVVISLILLSGYGYTLIMARLLLARIGGEINIPCDFTRETSFKEVKMSLTRFSRSTPEAKKAIILLQLNNYILCVFLGLIICGILFKTTPPFPLLSKNIRP